MTLPSDWTLTERAGLPEALRVLVDALPRADWTDHPNLGEMVQFWLQRHLMFRDLLNRLTADAEGMLDRRIAPEHYTPRLTRLGGFFLQNLHGHHQIEDDYYFPKLIGLDRRLERGFEVLDADHHVLHDLLDGFEAAANEALQAEDTREAVAGVHTELGRLQRLLDRHLTDEEEIIVPVILTTGFEG